MKRYTKVTLGIYKPIKVDYVEDQLFGTIERTNEIKYRDKKAIFYKYGIPININTNERELATWDIIRIKKYKKDIGNCHNPFHKMAYITNVLYKEYQCWYDEIIEDYTKEIFYQVVEPKTRYRKVIPLEIIRIMNLNWGDTWAKGYFNHPNKELCTTDTEEMVNYFKKYYNGYNAYKERLIEELISYKKQADKDCKEKGLVLIFWSDNE